MFPILFCLIVEYPTQILYPKERKNAILMSILSDFLIPLRWYCTFKGKKL